MTWTSLKVVIAALILFLGGHAGLFGPALAQSSDARKALVIGNAVYDNLPPVGAATGDALTLAGVLHAAGFDVTQGLNVDRDALRRLLRDFAEDLTAAGPETSGVIYFAGHADSRADAAGDRGGDGGEDGNAAITLLWPVDADPASPEDGIDLDWLMVQLIAAGNTHNSIVIDACHGGSGLGEMGAPFGFVLAFACQPGAPQSGADAVFATALATAIATTPDLAATDFARLFQQVRQNMFNATNGRQLPWDNLSGGKVLFLKTTESVSILDSDSGQTEQDKDIAARWSDIAATRRPDAGLSVLAPISQGRSQQ